MKYRREIDGLRALAIVPVILFHAGFVGLSGGYVGVDVFFVISGYLITTILAAELNNNAYSIVNFYERRARRILPALFVMLAVTLPIAYGLLNPADLRAYAKSLLGSVLFLANVTAYMQSGYFDAASDIKPLMHLWSLAIEEQYYVLFPVLLAFLWKFRQAKVMAVVSLISAISLLTAEIKLNKDASIAFFYLHSRAWELGVGALLALMMQASAKPKILDIRASVRQVLALGGLAMIVYAIVSFDKGMRFPGVSALVPVLGAVFVIAFATPETWAGKLLGARWFVGVGLISYSAYLWHQPIFAFARYQSPNHLGQPVLMGLIFLTGAIAYLSWRFVEAPCRNKAFMTRRSVVIMALSGIVLFSAFAVLINVKQGFPERYPKEFASAFDPYKVKEGKFCDFRKVAGVDDLDFCEFGDAASKTTVVLYGDSHASSLLGDLHEEFKNKKIKGLRVRLLNCNHTIPSMLNGKPTDSAVNAAKRCASNFDNLVEFVKSNADAVVVSARWTIKMYPVVGLLKDASFDNQEGGVEYHKNPSAHYAPTDAGVWVTDGEWKQQAVWRFLQKLLATQKQVLVVYPVPEVGWDLPLYNFSTYLQTGNVPSDVSTSRVLYRTRNQFMLDTLDDKRMDAIVRIRPEDFFCKVGDGQRCMAQVNWQPFYYDTNHLTSAGAKPIAAAISQSLAGK
jgi:peptidoglycan/LPS O-acetylase OafA/YrhL